MLQAIVQEGLLPFKYVVADCLYGHSPDFLDAVDACVGITMVVAIPSETRCWLQRPQTQDKLYTYKGDVRAKRVVGAPTNAPSSVAALAASLPAARWYQRTVSEGTKGPIAYAFARQRVTLCKEGLPDRTVWLVIKRTGGAKPVYSYYISNAPASTPWRRACAATARDWRRWRARCRWSTGCPTGSSWSATRCDAAWQPPACCHGPTGPRPYTTQ